VADWLREATSDAPAEPLATIAQQYEQAWTLWREPPGGDRGPPRDLASTAADYLARWADDVFAYRPRFAASLFERSLAILRAGPERADQTALARLLTGRAESLIVLGRQRDAVADSEEAERLARRSRDPRSRARALLALGQARSFLGEVEVARTLLEHARRLFEQDGDLRGQAHALERLAVAARLHDFDLQVDLYRRAHALFEEAGDRHGLAAVSQVLAYLLTWIGGREFEDRFAEARRIADEQGDTRSRASLARTYGYACWYRGEYDEAISAARGAGPDAALAGDRWVEVDALLLEAMATSVAGNAADGERLSTTLRGIADRAEAPRLKALALLVGVRPALRAGRLGLARRRLSSAARLLDQIGAASNERIEVCLVEAGFHLDRGDWPSVRGPAEEAERHAAEHGWRLYEPHGPLLLGRALLGAGDLREAMRELRRAASLARAAGTTGILASAQAAGAQARILSGASARPVRRGDHGPLVGAIDDENRGLLALRDGAAPEAAARFASAAAAWQTLGLTEWLARAHAFRADALRRGRSWRAARDAEDLARSIRESLRAPR
jgi:tetratricopeptide (TPR) repeat protein